VGQSLIDFLGTLEGRTGSRTHMHVIGSSDSGKSKFLEMLMRDAVLSRPRRGFCFIDFHGKTYHDLLRFFATARTHQEVVLINPSNPEYITGFNPFLDAGEDVSTTVDRRIDLTIKPWGAKSTDATPTLERVSRILYHFAIAAQEPLPNAALLLDFNNRDIFNFALSLLNTPEHDIAYRKLAELAEIKTPTQWRGETGSTDNRLTRFVGSKAIRRFVGMREGNVSIPELMERNAIVLVNLAPSGHLHAQAARVFAAMLLNEFFEAALRRAGTAKHYFLFLDEFQEYITYDLAAMLDQVRKGGLHLVMAHQRFGQLTRDPEIADAIRVNARLKVIFGGLPYDDLVPVANDLFLTEINERQIKETYYSQAVTGYERVTNYSQSEAAAWSDSAVAGHAQSIDSSAQEIDHGHRVTKSESEASTKSGTRQFGESTSFLPIHTDRVSGRSEWSREEKVSKVVERLRKLPQRNAVVVVGADEPVQYEVPTLAEYPLPKNAVATWTTRTYVQNGALPAAEADAHLERSRVQFLAKVDEAIGRKRRKKPQPPTGNDPKPNTKRPGI
jgi:hypothetical protein